jgi:Ca-activated chloride channel family protein
MFRCVPAVLCFAAVLEANGIIVPPPPPPRPFPPAPRLVPAAMKDVTLRVAVRDQVAVTEVEEIFVNPNDQPLEGTFILPIPPDAQVNDFTFFIDGKEVKGELLPRDKAQQYYQEIVSRMIDPGLLEYMDKGLVRVKLFPIPPRGEA